MRVSERCEKGSGQVGTQAERAGRQSVGTGIEEVELVVVLVADAVPSEEDELLGGGGRGTARVPEPS